MSRIDALLAFLADDPDDSFSWFALASEYRKAGRMGEAIDTFRALVARDAAYVGTYYHLGKAFEAAGQATDAAAAYRAGIVEASLQRDTHARSELQSALMELEGT